jgi:hypothetical protein
MKQLPRWLVLLRFAEASVYTFLDQSASNAEENETFDPECINREAILENACHTKECTTREAILGCHWEEK